MGCLTLVNLQRLRTDTIALEDQLSLLDLFAAHDI